MSSSEGISSVSGRKRASRAQLQAEFEQAYQEELQGARGIGAAPPDEGTLRARAADKVRSRHPEADPAELSQAAWAANQALRSMSKG